ncbi:gibberellin-regulated protein 11-like [Cornus florida]|uniref:gibberellin-regulated protein 11-like n=1 Tax=Cornus florida TaxID=4283 RepID=UPI00289D3238|nr:gibberellin-regulated protein 11-like [Cornus florida]
MAKLAFLLVAVFTVIFLAEVSTHLNFEDIPYPGQMVVKGVNRRQTQEKGNLDNGLAVARGHAVVLVPAPAPRPGVSLDCGGLCKRRCSLHSRPNLCNRACGTCCARCKCVPPGTSGNREMCGKCYTGMTTHRNQTKCP